MRKVLWVPAFVMAVSALAYGQAGFAGKWTGETQGRGGPQAVTLELKLDGKALSGTYTQGEQATPISDAKIVDASTITFGRSFTGRGGNAITLNYTGKLSGDELALTVAFPAGGPGGGGPGAGGPGAGGPGGGRGPMPITLKRAK